jgi:hypothetical protein
LFWLGSFYFCDLGAHTKIQNPTTTPSGVLNNGSVEEEKEKYLKQAGAELCQAHIKLG